MKKKFAAMAATLLALCFAVFPACDKGGEPNATGSVTGVKFTCDEIMFSGETVTLKATVETEGTVADKSVTWSVAGDDAEISAEGKLTLLQPGEITVTAAAKADPTKSASRKVEILQGARRSTALSTARAISCGGSIPIIPTATKRLPN